MLHIHIKSLPHHPKRVIIISLIIALAIGSFGYIEINKHIVPPVITNNSDLTIGSPSQDLTLGFLAGGRINTVSVKAGDKVKKGQVLATLDAGNTQGALIQAQAAYDKIINGATGPTIDVAKAAVNTAQVNLDEITKQQNLLVENAYNNLLNSTLGAVPENGTDDYTPPTITGTYLLGQEGVINLNLYYSSGGASFSTSGLVNSTGMLNSTIAQPIGNSGLYISLPSIEPLGNSGLYAVSPSGTGTVSLAEGNWVINIPNKEASNYLANYNAYQLALQTKSQTIAIAQAALDQANANLTALVTAARPEDIAAAKGALEIAQAAYQNTIITAPSDGTIVSVAIAPGQIAIPNAPGIEFISLNSSN
jgi:multidrug efflux pump subunit AcrA (membrane-fusion protein)